MRFLFLLCLTLSGVLQAQVLETRPLITVTGEAVEYVFPDMFVIRYSIVATINQDDVSFRGVLGNDNLDTDMKFVYASDEEVKRSIDYVKGNQVIREFVFTIKDLSRYKEVVNRLLKLNKGEIASIEFRTSKLADYKESLRVKAISAAKAKALNMVTGLGQNVGKAYTIIDNPSPLINTYNSYSAGATVNDLYMVVPGYISVSANVTVSFELVP